MLSAVKRRRRIKPNSDVILICNPKAGGRWKELAGILDSEEAQSVRRIVTDSVEDVAAALENLGDEAKLICIYGGDGTIQRILDRLGGDEKAHLALLGGGTMNVTSRWCGFTRDPAKNFRHVIQGYRSGDLLLKEVPLLDVRTGTEHHRGFTVGMGPMVRLLDKYEQGRKGKVAAVETAAKAVAAVWLKGPNRYNELLELMEAEVELDGEVLPYDKFSAVFANVTGQINPGVEPFKMRNRKRDTFHTAAYAVGAREMTMALPFLARGLLPVDISALLSPSKLRDRDKEESQSPLPSDPRYHNKPASSLVVRSPEEKYTVDGEILPIYGNELKVDIGMTLKLAMGPKHGSILGL